MIKEVNPSLMPYAWGSEDFIAELMGLDHNGPIAEAWFGAHPKAPALTADGTPTTEIPELAGTPFLVKFLSAARPLSIQLHPNAEQAKTGFAHENEAGLAIDDPRRNYRDPYPKPETIVALTGGMEVRAGIKPTEEIDTLFADLQVPQLLELWTGEDIDKKPDQLIKKLHSIETEEVAALTESVVAAAESAEFATKWSQESKWFKECSEQFGVSDPGVIIQAMLNYVHLEEGQALHMEADQPHAYLRGNGVEIMNPSDNVVRAGLTSKHVDAAELLSIGNFEPTKSLVENSANAPFTQDEATYLLYPISAESEPLVLDEEYQIALCVSGSLNVIHGAGELELAPGRGSMAHADDGERFTYTTNGQAFVAVSKPRA